MSPVGEAPLGRVHCRPARIHARTTNTPGLMPVNTGRLTGLALAFALMAAVSAAGQTLTPPGDAWIAPRTPDGQPDVQGTWTNETMTPLERPARLGDKAFYTEDEAAALVERALERRVRSIAPGSRRTVPLPPGSAIAGYNGFWTDPRATMVHTRRTSMVVNPDTGRAPLRPETEARRDAVLASRTDSHQNMSLYSRCITRGVPGSWLPNTYNTGHYILQVPGYVVIMYEMMRDVRIIPIDDRPHVSSTIGLWMGDSRGRWEGETLVVETTHFNDKGWIFPNQNAGRMHGVPVTRDLKVVERVTRVSEDILHWEATIEDPSVYTQPWTMELPLTRDPGYDLYEYACHEGNRAMSNILRGARVTERDDASP